MFNISESQSLFNKIYNNPGLTEELTSYAENHKTALELCVLLLKHRQWALVHKMNPLFKLALVFVFLPITKKAYDRAGIPDKVFFDTMSDIKIWIDDHRARTGEDGIFELNWLHLHLNLEIFKLGRLQFQLNKYLHPKPYIKNGIDLKFGDKILSLHIPRGTKLDFDECGKSFLLADDFFKKYYPDYSTDYFDCFSWLLYSGNKEFMDENSNILKFASRFDVVNEIENPRDHYLWLFGVKENSVKLLKNKKTKGSYGNTENLICKTELQKRFVKYVESGGKLGDAYGIINRGERI